MTWCITTCNFDVDVDLLFQENSTIGQKIALSEKIVSVLPRMKCPHQLEPHQIQGMDFIHIFPVVQWLVKRAIETKEEMGDYIRAYSISQFQKTYSLPEDDDFIKRKEKAIKTVVDLSEQGEVKKPSEVIRASNCCSHPLMAPSDRDWRRALAVGASGSSSASRGCKWGRCQQQDVYKPRRKYKRQQGAEELLDEESRIHATLLEYGRRYGFSRQSKTEKAEDKKTALPTGLSATEKADAHEEDELRAAEEQRIQSLMTKMTAMANEESRLTASSVGQIVGLCSAEIKQIVSEYAEKQSELSAEESPEKIGTSQLHRRKVISLNKQILQKTKHLEELQANHTTLQARYDETKKTLTELKSHNEKLDKEQAALEKIESKADPSILQNLRALVAMNENLKSQEQEFKAHCREEMTRLQQEIENLKAARAPGGEVKTLSSGEPNDALTPMMTHNEDLDRRYNMEKEKLYKIRLLQARRNREIAILHRKIDEVPSRAELIQYQKRFIELYRQISAVHKETKQFFTLYNTLDDKKVYLEKESSALDCVIGVDEEAYCAAEGSSHENGGLERCTLCGASQSPEQLATLAKRAMASPASRDQFLRQMEQIVEGIKQSRMKMEKKKQENKMRRDQLNDQYLELLEKQRLYFKTVKEFKEEGRRNEVLLSKMKAKAS
ncbi:Coiled-coil domain-containing protein 93 [Myotis davidii]|uniref:Coiled-coil domain-containing protein 93 n=1 Tax=Myotis davidii TaxID=225400 RepID=L5LJ78_MYODS|nr:Coiled-coil domain-containing protein 93 [Myotis davidii]